jgi:Ion channel
MTVLATIAGIALVVLALRDVYETLFHPRGRGVIHDRLVVGVWRAVRSLARERPELLASAGPLAFIAVLLTWIGLVVLGCALVIAPQMPEHFTFPSELPPEDRSGFVEAVYLSLVNLTSLGYGDIVANTEALRLLGPVETVIGLGLLTASISWLLSIYGVLAGSRSLAREVSLLADAQRAAGIPLGETDPAHAAGTLAGLASKVISTRRDLRHFPIAYYFHSGDPRSDLGIAVGEMRALATEAAAPGASPALRLEARKLDLALDDLLDTIAGEHLLDAPDGDPQATLGLWRRDHLWTEPEAGPGP